MAARRESVRAARRTYRRSPEGQAQHRDEERQRRARRRAACVGDQLVRPGARRATVECVADKTQRTVAVPAGPVQWRLHATTALAHAACALCDTGALVTCVCCGRVGQVAAVVRCGESPWRRTARFVRQRRRGHTTD